MHNCVFVCVCDCTCACVCICVNLCACVCVFVCMRACALSDPAATAVAGGKYGEHVVQMQSQDVRPHGLIRLIRGSNLAGATLAYCTS